MSSAPHTLIHLGLMAPLTGLVQIYGAEITNAASIACAEINANGGLLGQELELIVIDDGSLPETAVPAARRLVDEFECTAIIGNLLSNSRIAVAEQIAEPRRIPYLNFSFYEGSIVGRYFFHFAALPNQQIDCMIPYMAKRFGHKMYFAGSNYEWPRGSIDAAKRSLIYCGGEILGEEYLSIGELNIDDLLRRVAKSGADVFVPYFAGSDQINLLTRFSSLGLKSRMAVVMGHYDEAMAQYLLPETRAGFYSSNTYFMSIKSACNQSVLQRLAAINGITGLWPNGNGILTNFGEGVYICVHAFAEAVRCAGSLDREVLVRYLERVEVTAPQGRVIMDPATHHATVNTYLACCEADGGFTIVEQFGAIPPLIPNRYHARTAIKPIVTLPQTNSKPNATYVTPVNSGVAVFSSNGRIIHVNSTLLTLWGYHSSQQLIGQPIASLWDDPQAWHRACAGARGLGQDLFRLNARLANGKLEEFEILLDEGHGGHSTMVCCPIEATAIATPDNTVARILQMTDISIIACDELGIIMQSNAHAAAMFGYPIDMLIGLSVHQLLPPALRERHANHINNFVHNPSSMIPMGKRGEITGYRRDGSQFPAEASISKFRDNERWVMLASIRDLTEHKRQEAQSLWSATHDQLTGLPNRPLTLEHLTKAIARSRASNSQMALLLVDLDGLSGINDAYGHEVGDRLLITISERLLHTVRGGDIVGRLDGKAFVVLCEQCESLDAAAALATRVNDVVRQPLEIQGRKLFLTASIGLVVGGGVIYNPEDMLRDADIAMRHVKETGRDHWHLFSQDLHERAQRRTLISGGLRAALDQNEFSVRLHPIVDALRGTLKGAEVLLRWQPTDGPVSPDEFIPLAERDTTIVPIGMWVFEEACRIAARLKHDYGPLAPYLSVNVSTRQLSDKHLAEKFSQRLQFNGIRPTNIILELTETGIMTDVTANIEVLNSLANMGLRLAVDDFGTGYSSLLQLLRLPISILKIDKEFIRGIEKRGEHYTIVDAVLKMSRALHLSTIAEGVEHQTQAELLRELGCDLLQGYYFAQPLHEADFISLVAQRRETPLAVIEDVYFVIYASLAKSGIRREQMLEILKKARVRNARLNITGCLLYLNGSFMQYLEGPEAAIKSVITSIRADPRHYAVRDIIAGTEKRRLFRNWSMSFGDLSEDNLPTSLIAYRNQSQGFDAITTNPWQAYSLFRAMSLGLYEE